MSEKRKMSKEKKGRRKETPWRGRKRKTSRRKRKSEKEHRVKTSAREKEERKLFEVSSCRLGYWWHL